MQKIITILVLSVLFSAFCFAESPTSGLVFSIKQQRVRQLPAGYSEQYGEETQIDVEITNTLTTENSFSLEIIFIGIYNYGTVGKPNKFHIARKSFVFPVSLKSLERQSFSGDSIMRFHEEHNPAITYFRHQQITMAKHAGWIVRAIRDGEVIKLEASGAAMRRLAEPETISALLAGGKIPAK